MRKISKPLLAPIFLLVCAWAPPTSGLERPELAELLEDARVELKMPGLRAAVRFPDGRLVSAAVGLADKTSGLPLDDSIGMPGGSTGKMFVATLTMLLVEDGTIDLDDPASKWLGDRQWFVQLPHADAILVRHLLSHSSGLDDYPGTFAFNRKMIWRAIRHGSAYFTPEELIGFASGKGLFAPGEGFSYTDSGYLVLGRLIEAASGRNYYELLQELILTPQQLDDVRPQDTSVLPDIAMGYMGGGRALKKDGRMKYDPRSEWTGGGLVLTPTMLARFVAALAEGGIVSRASLQQMLESGWQAPGQSWHYGFGMFVAGDLRSFSHGGRWSGYRSHVAHDFETGVTVAIQTNRDGRVDMAEIVRRIQARSAPGRTSASSVRK